MTPPPQQEIVVLAFKAWAIGLVAVILIGLPLATIPGLIGTSRLGEGILAFLGAYPRMVLSNLVLVSTIGATLTAPLFGLGLGVGVLARRQIARRPVLFVALAVGVTIVLSGAVAVLGGPPASQAARFMGGVLSMQTLVFLSGIVPAVWFFCTRLARRST